MIEIPPPHPPKKKSLPEPQPYSNDGEYDVKKLEHGQETGTNAEANLSANFTWWESKEGHWEKGEAKKETQ